MIKEISQTYLNKQTIYLELDIFMIRIQSTSGKYIAVMKQTAWIRWIKHI